MASFEFTLDHKFPSSQSPGFNEQLQGLNSCFLTALSPGATIQKHFRQKGMHECSLPAPEQSSGAT